MPFTIDTELIENDDVQLTTDDNGDLAIEHVPTGNVMTLDRDAPLAALRSRAADLEAKTSGLSEDGSEADLDLIDTDGILLRDTTEGSGN